MQKENIRLEGLVLHSNDIDRLRSFYQALLGAKLIEEKHGDGPKHYSCRYGKDDFLELYPARAESAQQNLPVTLSSPSLVFRVPNIDKVKARMGEHFERVLKLLGPNLALCHDSNGRGIYLHQDETADEISLEEVVLHSQKIEEAKKFYQSLFNPDSIEYPPNDGKEARGSTAGGYIFRLSRGKIELSPSMKAAVPASPTLLFCSSHLDRIGKRMNSEIKESNLFFYKQEIMLYDPDGRKVLVYGKALKLSGRS